MNDETEPPEKRRIRRRFAIIALIEITAVLIAVFVWPERATIVEGIIIAILWVLFSVILTYVSGIPADKFIDKWKGGRGP